MARASEDDTLEGNEMELRFFAGLLAGVRYRENDCSWDYHGGEQDAASYRAFMEPMIAQTTNSLRKKSHGLALDEVKTLAQALLLGARLLRIHGAAANAKTENLKAMLAEAPPPESATEENDPWSKIREQARAQCSTPRCSAKLKLFRL